MCIFFSIMKGHYFAYIEPQCATFQSLLAMCDTHGSLYIYHENKKLVALCRRNLLNC